MDKNKLYLQYPNGQSEAGEYRLEMSYPGTIYGQQKLEENGSEGHSLKDYVNVQHCFHFGIRFRSRFNFNIPGIETNVFTEFCLFTCYLLQNNMSHIFNILVDQLSSVSPTDKHTLNAEEFKDFFEKCNLYMCDILVRFNTNLTTLKIILRMIGTLSIEKSAFDRYNIHSALFANTIMFHVRKNFVDLYESMKDDEWILFYRGLAMVIAIELLQYKSTYSHENKVIFLQQIPDVNIRHDAANKLLSRLFKLDEFIYDNASWTDLFTLVDPTKIQINHLNLTNSLETFITSIKKISEALVNSSTFEKDFEKYFEDRILTPNLEVDLNGIIFLITFFEQQLQNDSKKTKELLSTVQLTIRTNGEFKRRINDYMEKLHMTVDNMEEIDRIIRSTSKWEIFQYFDKDKYLQNSLSKPTSSTYLIKWAQCFLAKAQLANDVEKKKSKKLLENYIDYLKNNLSYFNDILKAIDKILDAFDKSESHDWFCNDFINAIIGLCFQQNSIFFVIADGLFFVWNKQFRFQFQKIFDLKCLGGKQSDIFKDMDNPNNPLAELIKVDRQKSFNSLLMCDLIKIICERIQMTKEELLNDTFNEPRTSTFTYISLFYEPFIILPIHRKMIKQLCLIWEEWESEGFRIIQINKWKSLTNDKKEIANEIWNMVEKCLKKAIHFKTLIHEGVTKYEEIYKTIEDVRSCVENFCQDAIDRDHYLAHLEGLEEQLNTATTKSAYITPEIQALKPFANQIRSLTSFPIWREYIKSNLELQKHRDTYTEHQSQLSCLNMLEQVKIILDEVIDGLKNLWNNQEQPLLPWLKRVFPQRNNIAQQFKAAKPHLANNDAALCLEKLLEYWENLELINDICRGYQLLFSKYCINISDGQLSVLQNILDIDETTSVKRCLNAYQDYYNHYSMKYSETSRLVAQWSKSESLLKFLYALKPNDIDDLQEIVNDWDETTTNTESVFSIILLKKFFDKLDNTIEAERKKTSSFNVHELISCLEKVLKNIEHKDIISTMESCQQNLPTIERIRQETGNREQSKRKRTLDVMEKSSFSFNISQLKEKPDYTTEYQFDVNIANTQWKESLSFDELGDLRDRARLTQYGNSNNADSQISTNNHNLVFQSFISLVDTIENILQSLTSLYEAGYPVIKQYIISPEIFTCQNGNYEKLNAFNSRLQKTLIDWEQQLCAKYKHCINLTYFSHQQLTMLDDALRQEKITQPTDPMYHLLKFIGINPQSIDMTLLPEESNEPLDLLKTIISIVQIDSDLSPCSIVEDQQKNKKVLVVETTNKGILRAIYSLCHLNDTAPVSNQLFYCTEKTSWMEIRAFIYRCFYSQKLHQLIRPELLSIVIQDRFTELLHQLVEQSPNHFFRLGIITTMATTNLYLINNFNMHHIIRILNDQEMLKESDLAKSIEESIRKSCKLVTSDLGGLGKSTYIQNEALQLERQHVKFSISGDLNISTLSVQLRDTRIQSASSPIVLHIDIGPVQNVQQLSEFLYCLVLFRCFRLGQMPVSIQTDIPIFIELDSSSYLSKLKDELVILQYLNTEHIRQLDWSELNNNLSSVQLVFRYLQAIDNETINTTNINVDTKDTLDNGTGISLLNKYFAQHKNRQFLSWTQFNIFISVYYKLFSSFSKCAYFYADPDTPSSLRLDILKALLDSSNQFTSLSVEKVRENQRSIYSDETSKSFSEAIIRWDKTQPFTLIFTFDNEPLFIYKTRYKIPESVTNAFRYYYQTKNKTNVSANIQNPGFFANFKLGRSSADDKGATVSSIEVDRQVNASFTEPNQMTHEQFFFRLTLLSKKYTSYKSICSICYTSYDYDKEICIKCSTINALMKPASKNDQEHLQMFQKEIAKKLQSEYVLTADNYVKMLLIYLRVQSNLPVLIMGETGCGKTALIQFLCQKILDDDMEIFRIHAGITNEMIIENMKHFIKKSQEIVKQDPKKRLWVFLDEFNTTPSVGLLKEIVCERTLLGERLPTNMILLGACNPQRRRKEKTELDDDMSIKKYHLDVQRLMFGVEASLLYSVVPVPESMLEHVWDYGHLDEATEKSYIEAVLSGCEKLTSNPRLFKYIVHTVSTSQNFFRHNEDESSVSLRDVARFCRFYKWFYKPSNQCESKNHSALKHHTPSECASLFALFFCYYFRLISNEDRKKYMELISQSMERFKPSILPDVLTKLLHDEKMALVNRMELPLGTAKNRALTDNIFVLFTCIVNRIPVILCGKPGSSKTSSVQIVISNLKGSASKDSFFQTLPGLTAISYQGSHNCTSESIIKTFQQADKVADAQAKKNVNLLPVIVFDEIGLAELSPHNPLKVLHSELEIERCRHGFVGLSNWRLDASKMNRAIYLCCPDLDLDDLKTTATSISESIPSNKTQAIPFQDSDIQGLAIAYTDMCTRMKSQQKYRNYFGLRDYYSLIKGVVHEMYQRENQNRDVYEIIRHQLAFNFNGIIDASKFMWSKFCEHMQLTHKIIAYPLPTFDRLIDGCLTSRNGRFLMLIGENENSFDYIQQYINKKYSSSIHTRTLIGSTLVGDLLSNNTYSQQYNIRILMDIIRYAETDVTLFLRGLRHLYDNLYDLFNQNFAVSEKKKYCRIALGSIYQPRCFIHDGFYCVVFVTRDDLEKYDPPFLNRFQKHLIDFDDLIHENYLSMINELNQFVTKLLTMKPIGSSLVAKHLFVEFSNDYILNLVTTVFDEDQSKTKTTENMREQCQERMTRTSSFDLPLLLSMKPSDDINLLLKQYYDVHTNLSFPSFINQVLQQDKIPPLLIYTYTQIFHTIDYSNIRNQSKLIEEVKLSHFKTELELIQKIKMHYHNDSFRLLFIRVDYHRDQQHLPMLKHLLLNEQIVENTPRAICLIFHLQRNKLHHTTNDVLFTEWSTVMIDDLQEHQLIPQEILLNPSYASIIEYLEFLQTERVFDELIEQSYIKLRYRVTNGSLMTQINEHRDQVTKQLSISEGAADSDLPPLRSFVKKHLLEIIQNPTSNLNQKEDKDWRKDLLTNEIVIGSCRSIKDALNKSIFFFLEVYLSALLAHLERNTLIDSHHFLVQSNGKTREQFRSLWLDCWAKTMKAIDLSIITQNYIEIPFVFDLHLPCAEREYELIRQIRHTTSQYQQDDRENDNDDDDDDNEKILNSAYQQLISMSTYGSFINTILNDSNLFDCYYHDQLTLTRNEANIHQLSTSFVQRLLTSKTSGNDKSRLRHLLVDYEELWEIMRIFEISISVIGDENIFTDILEQQFIVFNGEQEQNLLTNNKFYRFTMKEDSKFYLIHPGSSSIDQNVFECDGDHFIEVSLMNLLELLISSAYIDRVTNIKQLISTYSLVIQSMISLTYYDINNLEKVETLLRLASCLSPLRSDDEALIMFKGICRYRKAGIILNTIHDLYNFINHVKTLTETPRVMFNYNETLLKFESELLKIWSLNNRNQYNNILQCIYEYKLWKYSAKTFNLIDKTLELSIVAKEYDGQLAQNDDYEEINQYLSQLNDSTHQMEVLMMFRIYTQLIFDENYRSSINQTSRNQLKEILSSKFEWFQESLSNIKCTEDEQRLQRLSLLAWCRYYLLHYVYALKNDIKGDIMTDIDKILVENNSSICSTVKLYIIKQLCHAEHITFFDLSKKYTNRNISWIRSMITQTTHQQLTSARRKIILPTPLVECYEEFQRVDQKLNSSMDINQWKTLINECANNRETKYCFILWFIHHYTRFYMSNLSPDHSLTNLIQNTVNNELTECFEPVGCKLIYSLCNNFDEKSYFRLEHTMSEEELHQRLLVLNIIALLLSFKSAKTNSFLRCFLFDGNGKMPENYKKHFEKIDSFTGVALANDLALIQMMYIRDRIQRKDHQITNIFTCSTSCHWLYYSINNIIPDEQQQCPLCGKNLNVLQGRDGLIINSPHKEMNINEALLLISGSIENSKSNANMNIGEKPKHSLTYNFLDFFIKAMFLFLHESKHMSNSTRLICSYFREYLSTSYQSIRQHLSNIDQCHIWMYKLINHMMNDTFLIRGLLHTPEKVFEDQLILPHIDSVITEIREYKSLYANFVYADEKQHAIVNFVDELVEDEKKYPLLHFFNVTNIHSIDLIDDCYNRLRLLTNHQQTHPLTTFLLTRLGDYENIPYLYPIISFINRLMQQLNHRIKRDDAKNRSMTFYLKNDQSLDNTYQLFCKTWSKIDRNKFNFQDSQQQTTKFDNDTKISTFLLNQSDDSESKILITCLQTLAKLQNEILDHFHHFRCIPIQSIQKRHLFNFGTDQMRKFLVEKGLVINYQYGMSEEMFYNFDEIESMLRSKISSLPKIDFEHISYFDYQFELYDENVSLINNIRERFPQKFFDNDRKLAEIERFLVGLDNDSILQLSGSLEYILAYLCTITNENIIKTDVSESLTIQAFINKYLQSKLSISGIFRREPLSSINLEYIIDLYETIEEYVFDKIFFESIQSESLTKMTINNQIELLVDDFIEMISISKKLAVCLKDVNCWIKMFKRLLARLRPLKNKIDFDLPLGNFIKRSDMWKGNISKENLQTIEVGSNVQLKHSLYILEGLKDKKMKMESGDKPQDPANNVYVASNHRSNASKITTSTNGPLRRPIPPPPRVPLRRIDLR